MLGGMLINNWSPSLQIRSVLLSIQNHLSSPNTGYELYHEAAQHWEKDEKSALAKGNNVKGL